MSWVEARKPFCYLPGMNVKPGQIFELKGCVNDGGLIRHGLVVELSPQPTEKSLSKLPRCGTCGAYFRDEGQRDICGESHEMTVEDADMENRRRIKGRLDLANEADRAAGRV